MFQFHSQRVQPVRTLQHLYLVRDCGSQIPLSRTPPALRCDGNFVARAPLFKCKMYVIDLFHHHRGSVYPSLRDPTMGLRTLFIFHSCSPGQWSVSVAAATDDPSQVMVNSAQFLDDFSQLLDHLFPFYYSPPTLLN